MIGFPQSVEFTPYHQKILFFCSYVAFAGNTPNLCRVDYLFGDAWHCNEHMIDTHEPQIIPSTGSSAVAREFTYRGVPPRLDQQPRRHIPLIASDQTGTLRVTIPPIAGSEMLSRPVSM
jgi:hypothetical protein